jgi:hypothetical protein
MDGRIVDILSLALIGNDSEENAEMQRSWSNRVISDQETRRKPRVPAAGAAREKDRYYSAGIGMSRQPEFGKTAASAR